MFNLNIWVAVVNTQEVNPFMMSPKFTLLGVYGECALYENNIV